MLFRASSAWCLLLLGAVLNGGVREKLVRPRFGEEAGGLPRAAALRA